MDTTDSTTSELPAIDHWKLDLWRKISKNAESQDAFPSGHFDDAGCIKAYLRPYHELYNWFKAALTNPSRFDNLEPRWQHRGDGKWELLFDDFEDWLHVQAMNDAQAVVQKKAKTKKLRKGGMVVVGLDPQNHELPGTPADDVIEEDIDFIEDIETIPKHEDLPKEIIDSKNERSCVSM
ncbi:hypothetical protein LTR37_008766 [Vermiconidia calcicola]|uniref:Uncharacterized protein n=1 Tax=Vermiconidia calcicola TaxID=1690605 RepID=A0ACC3N9Z8_9PEZI|nr:hypothetical protein LTR37_008766 [Vermiconidia calcicola]